MNTILDPDVDARRDMPADGPLTSLEREALRHTGEIVRALMTPGRRFPSRRQLVRAWRLLQQLDGGAVREAGQPPSATTH